MTGTSLIIINEFKRGMSSKFEMIDLGRLTCYLGIEVNQSNFGITIKQEKCALKILKEACMETCNLAHAPMEQGLKLCKVEGERGVDATRYRKFVGCLRYLLHTKPDLAYAVGVVNRYMQEPKESHSLAVKHILPYLKGTVSYGLRYERVLDKRLVGCSDSSHNIDPDDGRSTTCHIFILALVL